MRVRHWGGAASTTHGMSTPQPPVTPQGNPHHHKALSLRCEDYFVHKRTCLGFSVYAVKSRSIAWIASLINLYLLLNAVRALHAFTPLGLDDYAITELASADACLRSRKLEEQSQHAAAAAAAAATSQASGQGAMPPNGNASAPLSGLFARMTGELATGLREAAETFTHEVHDAVKTTVKTSFADDLAAVMRTCRNQLAAAEPPGLLEAKAAYWWLAYVMIVSALVLDLLRWCGCCAGVTDAILGFRSGRMERFRLLPQVSMLLPFAHLTWLLSRPIDLPCCSGTPKYASVMDRVRVLAWLSLLVSYCLFSDAHNHGFFLLRSTEASACRLLRPCLNAKSAIAAGAGAMGAEAWTKV